MGFPVGARAVDPEGGRASVGRSCGRAEGEPAIATEAQREGASTLATTLTPKRVGHAFPTGDLFRRLHVRAWAAGEDGAVLGLSERFLPRHFEREPRKGAVERGDDRLFGRATVALDFGGLPSARCGTMSPLSASLISALQTNPRPRPKGPSTSAPGR